MAMIASMVRPDPLHDLLRHMAVHLAACRCIGSLMARHESGIVPPTSSPSAGLGDVCLALTSEGPVDGCPLPTAPSCSGSAMLVSSLAELTSMSSPAGDSGMSSCFRICDGCPSNAWDRTYKQYSVPCQSGHMVALIWSHGILTIHLSGNLPPCCTPLRQQKKRWADRHVPRAKHGMTIDELQLEMTGVHKKATNHGENTTAILQAIYKPSMHRRAHASSQLPAACNTC